MPIYDFICNNCKTVKEINLKLKELGKIEPVCDKCGLKMRKAVSAPAFHLKGGCWAKDNYSGKSNHKG